MSILDPKNPREETLFKVFMTTWLILIAIGFVAHIVMWAIRSPIFLIVQLVVLGVGISVILWVLKPLAARKAAREERERNVWNRQEERHAKWWDSISPEKREDWNRQDVVHRREESIAKFGLEQVEYLEKRLGPEILAELANIRRPA